MQNEQNSTKQKEQSSWSDYQNFHQSLLEKVSVTATKKEEIWRKI